MAFQVGTTSNNPNLRSFIVSSVYPPQLEGGAQVGLDGVPPSTEPVACAPVIPFCAEDPAKAKLTAKTIVIRRLITVPFLPVC
jgi:hypothetical protein